METDDTNRVRRKTQNSEETGLFSLFFLEFTEFVRNFARISFLKIFLLFPCRAVRFSSSLVSVVRFELKNEYPMNIMNCFIFSLFIRIHLINSAIIVCRVFDILICISK